MADGRPHRGGKTMLRRLIKAGVPVSYCLLNAVTYHMPQVGNKIYITYFIEFFYLHLLVFRVCVMIYHPIGTTQATGP